MESAKYTIKEAVQAIEELDFGEDTCSIKPLHSKKNAKQWHLKVMEMERPDIPPAVLSLLQRSQLSTPSAEKVFYAAKAVGQRQKL